MIQLKSDSEIDGIRTSGHMLAEMFEEIGPQIQAGMSTWDVDKLFHDWMKRHHAGAPCVGYMGYPAATCVSVNDMVIHGIPSKKEILKDGDVVSVDICLEKNGFISDSTHTYEIGQVSPDVHKLNIETEKSLYLGIDVLHLGVALHHVHVLVEKEECGHSLHVVVAQHLCVVVVHAYAYPRKGCRLCLPEVFVGVDRHLVYLESAAVVLVVYVAHHHDAVCRAVAREEMEVEQHHLALEV